MFAGVMTQMGHDATRRIDNFDQGFSPRRAIGRIVEHTAMKKFSQSLTVFVLSAAVAAIASFETLAAFA